MSSAYQKIRERFREEHGRFATNMDIRQDMLNYHKEDSNQVWNFIDEEMTVLGGRTSPRYDEHIQIYALDEDLAYEKLEEMIEPHMETAEEHLESWQNTHEKYRDFENMLETSEAPTFSSNGSTREDFTQDIYRRIFDTVISGTGLEAETIAEIGVRPTADRSEFNYSSEDGYSISLKSEKEQGRKPEELIDLFTDESVPVPELPVVVMHEASHVVSSLIGDNLLEERGEEYPVRSIESNSDINTEKAANEVARFALRSEDFTISDYGVPDHELKAAFDAYLDTTKWMAFDYGRQHPIEGTAESVEEIISKV